MTQEPLNLVTKKPSRQTSSIFSTLVGDEKYTSSPSLNLWVSDTIGEIINKDLDAPGVDSSYLYPKEHPAYGKVPRYSEAQYGSIIGNAIATTRLELDELYKTQQIGRKDYLGAIAFLNMRHDAMLSDVRHNGYLLPYKYNYGSGGVAGAEQEHE